MYHNPEELKYTKSHEWVKEEDGLAVVGLTDFAQDALGDIVFIDLPEVGDTLEAEGNLGDVESVKAVSDIFCPVSGTVAEVNEDLLDHPELINEDPYHAWLVKLEDFSFDAALLTSEEYEAFCEDEQ